MSSPALEVENLRVRLRSARGVVRAVDGVSFTVEAGTAHGIVGESGCGKTTLLRSILGLLPNNAEVTSGRVVVDGHTSLEPGGRGQQRTAPGVSIVFQEPMTALNPVTRVGDQIAEAPRFALGQGRRVGRARALDLMRQVGIPAPDRRYTSYPHELSGGLRQRVLIAMALSSDPKVILCDEPTTALDVTIQDQILKLLRRISDETGVAIVYVTHDLAVVAQTCASLSVMYAGRFVETGSVADVFDTPRHPYTTGLLGAVPDMSRGKQRLRAIPGTPPALIDIPDGCPFRPRCDFAQDQCRHGDFPLIGLDATHATACIRHEQLTSPVGTISGDPS